LLLVQLNRAIVTRVLNLNQGSESLASKLIRTVYINIFVFF